MGHSSIMQQNDQFHISPGSPLSHIEMTTGEYILGTLSDYVIFCYFHIMVWSQQILHFSDPLFIYNLEEN